MVTALVSGLSGPGSNPGSHSASLHPGVWMGTDEPHAVDSPAMD